MTQKDDIEPSLDSRLTDTDCLSISQGIADYVRRHGEQSVSPRNNQKVFYLQRKLADERTAEIYFTEGETRVSQKYLQAVIETRVTPGHSGQWGFKAEELGFSGRWETYILLLDPPSSCGTMGFYHPYQNVIPMPANTSGLVNNFFQHRYQTDMKQLLKQLLERH